MNNLDNIDNQILVYNNGEIELKISVDEETIWLTQKQLAELFEKDVKTVNEHIGAIYKEKELYKNSTIRKYRIVQKEGNREVSRDVLHYNLDVVLSVGYRVSSKKATKFRQWSTKVLKQYIYNGYTINSDKITHQRFKELENDVSILKQKVTNIDSLVVKNELDMKQGIFCDGETYDAYIFINNLFKSAKKEIVLVDNYIDDTVLTLLSKYKNVDFKIITKSISKELKLDIDKYNSQYKNLQIKISNKFHDRFLIIDNMEVYHIGASLKDLGKKVFAFSKMDIDLIKGMIR
jgi:hypothetical protein